MNKENQNYLNALSELFNITGHPLFFTLKKEAEKGNLVLLDNEKIEEETNTLNI